MAEVVQMEQDWVVDVGLESGLEHTLADRASTPQKLAASLYVQVDCFVGYNGNYG
jgi:hypothetical protein